MKIVTSAQMAEIERRSDQSGVSTDTLMENAGAALAVACRRGLGADEDESLNGAEVLVLVGPGNNGGDGLVAARHLDSWGAATLVYACVKDDIHPKALELPDSVPIIRSSDDPDHSLLAEALAQCSLVLDALLGTGSSRPLSGHFAAAMAALAQARADRWDLPLVAADFPTGVAADTGAVDPHAVRSDFTVAMGRPKIGHCTMPGAEYCGLVIMDDIGIPEGLDDDVDLTIITPGWAQQMLPERPAGGHKGSFGRALIVAGCRQYVGAALLASSAASRAGAGLVTAAVPSGIQMAMAAGAPQVTYLPLPETPSGGIAAAAAPDILSALGSYDALAVGCGLGLDDETGEMLTELLLSGRDIPPAVIDADALNFLSSLKDWPRRMASPAVLTPHPGEMSRLTGAPVPSGAGRIAWAKDAAQEWGQVVVLKGAYTVICHPDDRAMIAPFANPGLATAGTGDVLSGVIAGLLAQGLPPFEAAALGVCLHGSAGEAVRDDLGEAGMVAGDLLPELPRAIRTLADG